MEISDLQRRLSQAGSYNGAIDGDAGPQTQAAVLDYLTKGPDLEVTDFDFTSAAAELGVPVSYVKALYMVESTGHPFVDGRPVILFEPHRFHKATGGKFAAGHPHVSYPTWDPKKYPATQQGRYTQLVEAVCLDPDAGFASASYGGFQILGENYARCGCADSMGFAWQESQSTGDQLGHFVKFIKSDPVLHGALIQGRWATVAKRYNGPAYATNRYDVRLAQAVRKSEMSA